MAKRKAPWQPSLAATRLVLFVFWCILFGLYIAAFFWQAKQPGIDPKEAQEAALNILYIMGPIMLAFGTFYLGPDGNENVIADDRRTVSNAQVFVMSVITILGHGIIAAYFSSFVWFQEFHYPNDGNTYWDAVTGGFKWLTIAGTIPILSVKYVLKGQDVSMGSANRVSNGK